VVLDGAHNQDKVTSTLEALKTLKKANPKANVHLIIGMSQNKQIDECLEVLVPAVDHVYTTRFTKNYFRKVCDPRDLVNRVAKIKKIPTEVHLFPTRALESALHKSGKCDIVLVTGSVFLAGELRERWHSEEELLSKRTLV
jgi:folylpolyglutamate synthase/dihydropteroate synthase